MVIHFSRQVYFSFIIYILVVVDSPNMSKRDDSKHLIVYETIQEARLFIKDQFSCAEAIIYNNEK